MDRLVKKYVWHDNCQPNVGQIVIVIDENNTIYDFRWTYMKDLVDITNGKEK